MKFIQRLSYVGCNILCILFFCFFSFLDIKSAAYDAIEVIIPVSCLEISDNNTHTYEINIEKANDITPQPTSDKLIVTDNGIAEFRIEITEPGTYLYKVYEKFGDDNNIVYDDTIYYITVFVTNTEQNTLTYAISVQISGKDSKSDELLFQDDVLSKTKVSITDIIIEETSIETSVETSIETSKETSVETSVTTITESTTSLTDITTITSDITDTTTITNLIDNFMTGDYIPIKLLFVTIGISIAIASIMVTIRKKE